MSAWVNNNYVIKLVEPTGRLYMDFGSRGRYPGRHDLESGNKVIKLYDPCHFLLIVDTHF